MPAVKNTPWIDDVQMTTIRIRYSHTVSVIVITYEMFAVDILLYTVVYTTNVCSQYTAQMSVSSQQQTQNNLSTLMPVRQLSK